jgi:hypothetical protein
MGDLMQPGDQGRHTAAGGGIPGQGAVGRHGRVGNDGVSRCEGRNGYQSIWFNV